MTDRPKLDAAGVARFRLGHLIDCPDKGEDCPECDEAIAICDLALAALEQQWVLDDERLPKDGERVELRQEAIYYAPTPCDPKGHWHIQNIDRAWRSLPAPPTGGNREPR